ncbi:hypothetical protein [Pedobacter xixiisoli]|uniref:Uncharacterized protein n=1 Tax=Pedobacter xixiisoli TaxID=1476464 RepID=A0A286A9V8_9SPHI|nr:hypothetical protein [Pedobacter xixiisoli]SOD18662.1 hypothetical protein SAMN06297358_3121 [Pedobacter xixiisoli]
MRSYSATVEKIKCISFSLYGQNKKYLVGALENVKLAEQFFPDFYCYFFYNQTVPITYIQQLEKGKNVRLLNMENSDIPPMMWRFTAIELPEVGLMLSRDTDSRLNYREKTIIEAWEKEPTSFLMIKDHPGSHGNPFLMGGLWAAKNVDQLNISQLIRTWLVEYKNKDKQAWGADQDFLMSKIYPLCANNLSYYDDYNINKVDYCQKISYPRENWHFIGEIFDENNRRDYHWKALRAHHWRSKGFLGYCFAKVANLFVPEWKP